MSLQTKERAFSHPHRSTFTWQLQKIHCRLFCAAMIALKSTIDHNPGSEESCLISNTCGKYCEILAVHRSKYCEILCTAVNNMQLSVEFRAYKGVKGRGRESPAIVCMLKTGRNDIWGWQKQRTTTHFQLSLSPPSLQSSTRPPLLLLLLILIII